MRLKIGWRNKLHKYGVGALGLLSGSIGSYLGIDQVLKYMPSHPNIAGGYLMAVEATLLGTAVLAYVLLEDLREDLKGTIEKKLRFSSYSKR